MSVTREQILKAVKQGRRRYEEKLALDAREKAKSKELERKMALEREKVAQKKKQQKERELADEIIGRLPKAVEQAAERNEPYVSVMPLNSVDFNDEFIRSVKVDLEHEAEDRMWVRARIMQNRANRPNCFVGAARLVFKECQKLGVVYVVLKKNYRREQTGFAHRFGFPGELFQMMLFYAKG